jgi:hypothetical protein
MSIYVCVNKERFLCNCWHAALGIGRKFRRLGYSVRFEV